MQETSNIDFLIMLCAIAVVAIAILFLFIYILMLFQTKIREKNRIMASMVIETQEEERKRIGADLHDDMGPLLARLKNEVYAIPDLKNGTKKLVEQVMSGVRTASHNLYPVGFELLGLVNCLEGYCATYMEEGEIKVHFKKKVTSRNQPVAVGDALNIYRLVTEVITNALKHSTGDAVWVQYVLTKKELRIEIEDNGNTFLLENKVNGLGMQNVKNRAELVGGHVRYHTTASGGCRFKFVLPHTAKVFNYVSN
ncbi:MAG: signal transduction histidine kinase [Luteibaculaceae bacterium]|jgi:signal transduction histidine kinase